MSAEPSVSQSGLASRYAGVRKWTEQLCEPLEPEDFVVQSMPDASPVKWHLAHTSWFFETFVLEPFLVGYQPVHPLFRVLFNSYYETVGPQFTRAERGMLTRPSVREVFDYRRRVDESVLALLVGGHADMAQIATRIELGLQHEQQHQELLLTDLLHALSKNPLQPVYRPQLEAAVKQSAPELRWQAHEGGISEIGYAGAGFAFDNERPRHRVLVEPYRLATRLVTQGEYLEFMRASAYSRPELWLSEGYAFIRGEGITAPQYWEDQAGEYGSYTLHGALPLDPAAPVSHVSFYEADAFARWAGARLPTEAEWELTYAEQPVAGQFVEDGALVPRHTDSGFGSSWVWTQSAYLGYPGFRSAAGALGEYNGKFMCNQWVLRGGSCFSPRASLRASYRNFFPASARWQMTGIRLAAE
jgi:ergothioneine biosynthesis protein EgtB